MHLYYKGFPLGGLKGPFQPWHQFLNLNTLEMSWRSGKKDYLSSTCTVLFDVFSMWDKEPVCPPRAHSAPSSLHLGLFSMAVLNICQKHLVPGWLLPQVCPRKALEIRGPALVYVTQWVAKRMCTKDSDSTVGQPSVTTQGDSADSHMQQFANPVRQSTLVKGAENSASTLYIFWWLFLF